MVGGADYLQAGGGANHLCLPDEPEFLEVVPGLQSARSRISGAEYEIGNSFNPLFISLHNKEIPCALCYTPLRSDKIEIPARISCPPSWTREYTGYLMSSIFATRHRSNYECVDENAVGIPGSAANTNGHLFYFTEVLCTTLNCPPYFEGNELACVVCTQ